jgi:uncharacterized membrane protein YecN with MAPEG domain
LRWDETPSSEPPGLISPYALTLFAVGLLALLWDGLASVLHFDDARVATPGARIGVAAAALLPACAVLAAMIASQMALRWRTGTRDPLAGEDGPLLRLTQRVISNTVEQLALFAPSLLALAGGVRPQAMPGVVSAGIVFAIARLLFWAGYARSAPLRAPGMAATFTIGCATIASAAWVWLA